ncbi:hypothetical protein TRICI_003606 [Trichomonascus ciferrii]|uniref:Phospholipid/glycerol acyltransferase domain-containing protein n=1 Tax=Trichomonascus ciferrii TaxID=44093 RepID=A0A642V3K3_9ASCO|nr:hypothetical protein TRICI_003606 [Trichomonascus ciferrii]
MEKFSKYRDEATGIAPYLPISRIQDNQVVHVLKHVVGILKLPIIFVLLLIHGLVVQWIPPARQSFLKLILLVMGLHAWNVSSEDKKRSRDRRLSKFLPQSGDMIVSNFISPLDPLVYSVLFDSMFALPTAEGNGYVQYSAFSLFFNALTLPTNSDKNTGRPLAEILSEASAQSKVLVVFPEGTTSNGRGLLPIVEVPVPKDCKVFPTALKYEPQEITTPLPRNAFLWLYQCISNFHISAYIRFSRAVTEVETKDIAAHICQVGRLKMIGQNLDRRTKAEFANAWNRRNG